MQLAMSVATLVIGLLIALVLGASSALVPFGWLLAAVGVLGIVVRFALPPTPRRPRRRSG